MTKKDELIDELLRGVKDPNDLFGKEGLLKQLTKSLVERALEGELTDHLGYKKHSPVGKITGNSRNGTSQKTLKGDLGEIIPDYIPAEMLYNKNIQVYLGITSIALANVETDNVVSLVHLIPFHEGIDMTGSIQNQEMRRKNNHIHYPKTLSELQHILGNLIHND